MENRKSLSVNENCPVCKEKLIPVKRKLFCKTRVKCPKCSYEYFYDAVLTAVITGSFLGWFENNDSDIINIL